MGEQLERQRLFERLVRRGEFKRYFAYNRGGYEGDPVPFPAKPEPDEPRAKARFLRTICLRCGVEIYVSWAAGGLPEVEGGAHVC